MSKKIGTEPEEVKAALLESIGKELPAKIEVNWKENNADIIHEENSVSFTGIITSPLEWIRKRISTIDQKSAHIIVTPQELTIQLITEERNFFKNNILGRMEYDETFLKFKINTGSFLAAKNWAEIIKKNKAAFDSLLEANKLMLNLLNFKTKIEEDLEKGKDNKGNLKEGYERKVISSNLPDKFKIKVPIFKGQKPISIEVEFEVSDGHDMGLSLWSDFVQVEVEKQRNNALSEVIDEIKKIAPDIVIFEK